MQLNSIEEIIEDIRLGRMVVLMDDEDRENEGDLIMAASLARPEDINFMARYGRGLICLTLTRERCERLHLPLMVSDTNAKHSTNFTVSIEASKGVTTGISAADRAVTVLAAVAPNALPGDIDQPGHIFPLMAQPGGVLTRAGHTEAGCDLARLAGLEPAAVIVEILNEDGTMARRPDLEVFAKAHGLKIGTVADLIHYRLAHETTVRRVAECDLPTRFGTFRLHAYRDESSGALHLAMTRGSITPEQPVLVRVHVQNAVHDMLDVEVEDGSMPLHSAMERIVEEGAGVVVVLRQREDDNDLVRRIRDFHLHGGRSGLRNETAFDLRSYGIGAQILTDLGVRRMRVLSAPKRLHGLAGFGLEVVEYLGTRQD